MNWAAALVFAAVAAALAVAMHLATRWILRKQDEQRERDLNRQVKLAALAWMAEAAREREAIKRDVRAWRALADRATQTDARS